ncbi:hypothetical protein Clo1100_1974 [Clostridium sp. BNL1100]|nr:hypothetical protein Clo1100_1974 [Clostridium sp. BNL1100]
MQDYYDKQQPQRYTGTSDSMQSEMSDEFRGAMTEEMSLDMMPDGMPDRFLWESYETQRDPPFGPPPGMPPFGGAAQGSGPPPGPPPAFVPSNAVQQQSAGVLSINPGAIRPCRFRFVYLWLNNGQRFWAWLVFVGPRSVAGWRWTGFRWVYFGIDTRRIASFVCY